MLETIKTKWVAALRSGKYQQGTGALCTGDKFCCLGVLCNLAVNDGIIKAGKVRNVSDMVYYGNGEHARPNYLPREVESWAQMDSSSGHIPTVGALADLNDSGKSFEEIATIIEENWEVL